MSYDMRDCCVLKCTYSPHLDYNFREPLVFSHLWVAAVISSYQKMCIRIINGKYHDMVEEERERSVSSGATAYSPYQNEHSAIWNIQIWGSRHTHTHTYTRSQLALQHNHIITNKFEFIGVKGKTSLHIRIMDLEYFNHKYNYNMLHIRACELRTSSSLLSIYTMQTPDTLWYGCVSLRHFLQFTHTV